MHFLTSYENILVCYMMCSVLFYFSIDLMYKSWYSDLIYMYIGDRDECDKFYEIITI